MKKHKGLFMVITSIIAMMCFVCSCNAADEADVQSVDVAVHNSADGVQIEWKCNALADSFKICKATGQGTLQVIEEVDGATSEYIDTAVNSGILYKYSVIAVCEDIEVESNDAGILHLSVPQITCSFNNTEGIVFGWQEVTGASSYKLYKDGCKSPFATVDGDILSYTDRSVTHGSGHTYSVEACYGKYVSYPSFRKTGAFVNAPQCISVSNGDGYTCFRWQGVEGVDNYYIYKKTTVNTWKLFTKTSGRASYIVDRTVKSGDKCTYTIQAVKGGAISGYDSSGVTGAYVSKPTGTKVINAKNGLYVSWARVAGASKYMVYRRDTINTSWRLVYTGTNTYLQDNRVANGVYFAYTVRAVSRYGNYSVCDSKGTYTIALKMPTINLGCTPYGIMVSWSKLASADEYRIYRKAPGEISWKCVKIARKTQNTYFVDTNVVQGQRYTYTIKQIKNKVQGSYNINGVSSSFFKAPVVSVRYGSGGITVSWSKPSIGMGYIVERRNDGGAWMRILTLSGLNTTRIVDKGYAKGENNYYRVRVNGTTLVSNTATIRGFDASVPMVALTYDDGPYSPVTNRILDTLEKYDSKATFFVVGERVNSYSSCIKRAHNMGCEIANHTYSHKILTTVDGGTVVNEINRTNNAVYNITGKSPTIVRAPGGEVNSYVLSVVNYPFVGWDVDTLDWSSRNATSVVSRIKNNVRDGSIVLMHDLYSSTASATEQIVPWLVSKGYCLVTVSELMEYKNIDFYGGKVYHCAY